MAQDPALEFPSDIESLTAILIVYGFAFVISLLAGVFFVWLTAREVANIPSGTASWLGILGGIGAVFAALGSAFLAFLIRPFSVRAGVMTLRVPVRLDSGRRTRSIPLSDVRRAQRLTQETADSGVLLTLSDGTRFSVFDADLVEGGTEFLDRLVAAVEGTTEK
jgi:hypothetical protein